jgi:hypothetical protein
VPQVIAENVLSPRLFRSLHFVQILYFLQLPFFVLADFIFDMASDLLVLHLTDTEAPEMLVLQSYCNSPQLCKQGLFSSANTIKLNNKVVRIDNNDIFFIV